MTMTKPPRYVDQFPPAPADMPEELRSQWDATVRAFPVGWFRGSDLPLLTEMIRAHAMADTLHKRIGETTDLAELKTLLQLRDVEARRAAALATKLRLPPQSRSDRHLAGREARDARGGAAPWEWDPAEEYFRERETNGR